MEDKAHVKAALQLIQAAETRIKRAQEHLYGCEDAEDIKQDLISTSLKLYAAQVEIRLRYKI